MHHFQKLIGKWQAYHLPDYFIQTCWKSADINNLRSEMRANVLVWPLMLTIQEESKFWQLKSLFAFIWFDWKYPIKGGLILLAS